MGTGAIDFQSIEGNQILIRSPQSSGARTFKNLVFRNAYIKNNNTGNSYYGGAINVQNIYGTPVTITGCTFEHCYNKSGRSAITLYANSSKHEISNTLITGCTGGAAGMSFITVGATTVSGCTFSNNLSGTHGDLFVESSTVTVTNCKFSGSVVNFYAYSGTVSISGCTFNRCYARLGTVVLTGTNKCYSVLRVSSEFNHLIVIASGAIINLQGSDQANAIVGSITAEGDFTLIDMSGVSHTIPAGSYSTIHRDGTYE